MMTAHEVENLLKPFGVELDSHQLGQVTTYLEILKRWNRHVNLTGIHDESECVVKLFGESFYVSRYTRLRGRLLDIGSGAGFPGLVLRIIFPDLHAVLLEPVAKKRAFLKEVARFCEIDRLEVRCERLEEYVALHPEPNFQVATSRAVGHFSELLPLASRCLVPGGRLFLWISHEQGAEILKTQNSAGYDWGRPTPIPRSSHGEIWCGNK
jgi:16S rRNA (guanine527-N7)-methyltransferase